jgi:hypothetical protein
MLIGFLILNLLVLPVAAESDPVENLIQDEHVTQQPAPASDEELPPMFLFGSADGVKIYSRGTQTLDNAWVCQSLELDEVVQLTRGDPSAAATTVNLDIPRVKTMFEDSCLIRTGDYLMALALGFQKIVSVNRFSIRQQGTGCSRESSLTLWANLEDPLEQEPFLYSTNLDLPEGGNDFRNLDELSEVSEDKTVREHLDGAVRFINEYDVKIYLVNAPNCKYLAHVKRRSVTLEDNGLPNEILLWAQGDEFLQFWIEKVDERNGSGHIRIDGVWDYNGDGLVDLLINADHQKCPYHMLFNGLEKGFEAEEIPNEPCGC